MSGTDRDESGRSVHPRRLKAYELLASGVGIRAVGRALKVKPDTVIAWRDSDEGQREIRSFGEKLASVRQGALIAAEKRLGALTARAVDTLAELIDCDDPNVRLKAAVAIADRGGLPKTERVEMPAESHDYSDLTDDELETLRAAQAIRERKGVRG